MSAGVRMIPQVEAIKNAQHVVRDEFAAWLVVRDHAQAQLDRLSEESLRLLKAEGAVLKAEVQS